MEMSKWLAPAALAGGLGAAILCGAGAAGADTGSDAGSNGRGSQVSASSPRGDNTARAQRSAAAQVASARTGAPKPSRSPGASAARKDNKAPVNVPAKAPAASALRPAAATASAPAAGPAPAAATPAAAAAVPVTPSSTPIDPAQYAGTYYEQGSVKQFFSIGLVNTKAVYTVKPDGTLGVQNSGNYFFKRGLKSSIKGSAVPVNDTNTALNVGFGGTPSANPPGNYVIVDRAPDYSWVIVSDPSGRSGYILTRSQTIDPQTYAQLVARSRELGVTGRITPTRQFPN